jgi:hypothetical protein
MHALRDLGGVVGILVVSWQLWALEMKRAAEPRSTVYRSLAARICPLAVRRVADYLRLCYTFLSVVSKLLETSVFAFVLQSDTI